MKKSLKTAHKLMLLIGSVIVVAGVIVLAQQLKSSAQIELAASGGGQCNEPFETWDSINNVCIDCNHNVDACLILTCKDSTTQSVCAADGRSVCSTACSAGGGGGVDKTCFAIYGRYNPYRAIIPGSLATQDLSELERIKAIAGLDTSAKVDEALRATNLKANIDALYTQDRVREMSAVKAEVTKRISEMPDATYTQMRPIFDAFYVATVSIPIVTAQDLESKYVGFDLRDPRACDQTNGGGGQCPVDDGSCGSPIPALCGYPSVPSCRNGEPSCQDCGGGLLAAGADGETNPRLRLAECVGNPNLCGAVVLDSEIIHRVRLDQIREDLSRYFAPIEAQMVEIAVAPTENVVANAVDNNVLETAAVVEAVNQAAETAATLILDIPPISAAIDATVQQAITADAASNASEKAVGTIKALNPSVTATEIAAVQAQVTKTVTEVITAKVNAANK